MKLRRRRKPHPLMLPAYWALFAATSAVNVTLDLRLWTAPAWTLPQHSWVWLVVDTTAACLCTVLAVRSWRSPGRREMRRLVVELAALAKPMRDGTWLNRDEHLIFQVHRRARVWVVARVPEDAAYDAAHSLDEQGTALMFEAFAWMPGMQGVYRDDEMGLVALEGDDVVPVKLPGGPGRVRRVLRQLRPSGALGTSGAAPPEVVRDLIRQLRESERMSQE